MKTIIAAYRAWRFRRAISSVRREFAWWGFSLDSLSDDELMEGVSRIGSALKQTGFSCGDLANSLSRLQM